MDRGSVNFGMTCQELADAIKETSEMLKEKGKDNPGYPELTTHFADLLRAQAERAFFMSVTPWDLWLENTQAFDGVYVLENIDSDHVRLTKVVDNE